MIKSTIQVTLFSLLGIAINFLIQLLLAYYFGATQERDAYFAALTIPTYIAVIFTGSIGMMLLPYLVKYQTEHDSDQLIRFTSSIVNFSFLSLLGIVILGYLLASPIMHVFLPAAKQDMLPMTVSLFQIQMLSILFTVLSTFLASIFQARHVFLLPSIFPLITGAVTALFVALFSNKLGIRGVALGSLTGAFLAFVFMFVNVIRRFDFRWPLAIGLESLRGILYASLPLFVAGIVFRASTVIERFFAARLPEGSLSYLGSGNQIIMILSTIVSSGIATTSFPLLAKYWTTNDLASLEKTFIRVISLVILIIFPMIVIFAISGVDIISLLFQRGAFRPQDTEALYYTLLGLMGFFLFSSIGNVLIRILYLSGKTMAVAIIGTIELIIYVLSALILTRLFQYVGLAISMSFASGCNILMSFIFVRKKVLKLDSETLLRRLGKILASAILLFLPLYFANKLLMQRIPGISRIAIITVLVASAYGLMMSRLFKNIGYRQLISV